MSFFLVPVQVLPGFEEWGVTGSPVANAMQPILVKHFAAQYIYTYLYIFIFIYELPPPTPPD